LYLDGWYYLMFTDTTGRASGWNGAGQFVVRAKDPVFSSGLQALTDARFAAVSGAKSARTPSLVDAFRADWMWVDALNASAVAGCPDAQRTAAVLDGYALPSPQRTIDLVVAGALVRIDRRSVADALAVRILEERPAGADGMHVAAHLAPGVAAVQAEGRPVA